MNEPTEKKSIKQPEIKSNQVVPKSTKHFLSPSPVRRNLETHELVKIVFCFGVLMDSLDSFLFVLASVESRVLNDQLRQQGLQSLDGEDLSSVTAHSFQSSLARVSLAAMRATSARLTGRSSQPRVPPPPVQNTIRRQSHISDFVPSDIPRSP